MTTSDTRRRRHARLVDTAFRELGWGLIALGVLAMLLAAYLVWGTRAVEARNQAMLRRGFAAAVTTRTRSSTSPRREPRERIESWVSASSAVVRAIDELRIPSIGLDAFVVDGVSDQNLAFGPGHYPGTALPGQVGNAAIAGHRTTYGAPFYSLDSLRVGDRILVTDRVGHRYVYRVARAPFVVPPSDVTVLAPTRAARLTLTTCTPRYWATSRLVVVAALVGRPTAPRDATLDAHVVQFGPVAPAQSGGVPLASWLWVGLLGVLWLALRAAARALRGRARVLSVGVTLAAATVVAWLAFASQAGALAATS